MKKSISKTIVTIAIVTAFLMPLMGNTALADSPETYYFNSRDTFGVPEEWEEWEVNQDRMIDGDPGTFASTTTDKDVQLLDGNDCSYDPEGTTITTVEIRARGKYSDSNAYIILRPVFDGSDDGIDHTFTTITTVERWSPWFDITYGHQQQGWTWTNVANLDCDVEAKKMGDGSFTLFCSKVEIQVTYTTP